MNRFKTSKFRNTTPKIAKKDEWIDPVRAGSWSCQGNRLAASASLVAFCSEQAGGGMLGLTSVKPGSDGQWKLTQISCHSGSFPSFPNSLSLCPKSPFSCVFPPLPQILVTDMPLPPPTPPRLPWPLLLTAPSILHAQTQGHLTLLEQHGDQVQSLSWKHDGSLLASSCKDKMLRVFDPRAQLKPVQSTKGLQSNKDSRILWVKDDFLVTTGFDMMRCREVKLWDRRALNSSIGSQSLGTSSG
uniref:Coronin n=1 Tax=Tetraodon nigroviridis TaxID=99883 RepID=H3CWJ6_TETNG